MASVDPDELMPGPLGSSCQSATGNEHGSSAEERARALELSKYFRSASIVPGAEQTALDDPRLSQDNTLTALAQLGTFRLDCDRSFISLIDRESQYIIAESTKTTSLLLNGTCAPSDGVYLGARALPLSFGVCPQTIQIFTSDLLTIDTANITADRSRYIIRDFCADPNFNTRPYVTGYPHMRSYAEVPLTSASGWVIGSYCVVDTKPRSFDAREIGVLSEVASTIMNHLDLMKSKIELGRVERLVRGLGSYVAGHSGLQEQQTRPLLANASTGVSGALQGMAADLGGESSTQNQATTQAIDSSSNERVNLQTAPSPAESANESFGREDIVPDRDATMNDEHSHQVAPLSQDMRVMFSRAGNLIRQCMDMQGVVFVDAGTGSLSKANNPPNATTTVLNDSSPSTKCKVLGNSTKPSQIDGPSGFTPGFTNINEDLLDRMLARHPFGHIYSFDELGMISSSQAENSNREQEHPSRLGLATNQIVNGRTEEQDAAELFQAIEHARSIFFLPLWDFNKDRWNSAALGWTTERDRVLDFADLHYLSAFGNSIQAEVSRIESSALSSAKSDFISSISHELRSPLHGILAGTEILRESMTSMSETSMLNTIDTCGTMLLDTMNHLLDFAKINSLTKKGRKESRDSESLPIGDGLTKVSTIDLGQLVQDVVEGVYLGFSSRQPKQPGLGTQEYAQKLPDDLVVLVDIDPTVDWTFDTEPGAWKRILMNLFGNALKYTSAGQVVVKLSLNRPSEPQIRRPGASKYVCLQLTDTGRGMSADFLKHKLFTPFAQENHLSVGTGLGLSIVHQLVRSLDGSIDVQSKLNAGTAITVMIPIGDKTRTSQPKRSLDASTRKPSLDSDTRFKDCQIFISPPSSDGSESVKTSAERKLFEDMARGWCGMAVSNEAKDREANQSGNTFFLTYNGVSRENKPAGWQVCHQFSSAAGKTKSTAMPLKHPHTPKRFAIALSEARAAAHDESNGLPLETGLGIKDVENETQTQLRPSLERTESGNSRFSSPLQFRSPRPPDETSEEEQQLHILLVDDNFINLKVLSTCIDKTGCTYVKATNGKEAVDLHETSTHPFDLIFMDLSMPVMDGYEATRRIRKREEIVGIRRAHIVALTALGSNDAKREACQAGVDMFISKPVKMADIRTLVETERLRLNSKETLEQVNARLGPQSTITACG